MFLVLLGNHLLKKPPQLKDLCWIILSYFGAHFGRVPLLIEDYLYSKDVFCITLMLTALKQKVHSKYSSPGGHFGVFLLCFVVFLHYFLRTIWFLIEFCTYILHNTMMVVRLKDFMGGGVVLCLGLFWFFFFCREGAHFQFFSLFLEKALVYFYRILQRYSWYYSSNHTKNNMACCFHFARLFLGILGPICPFVRILQFSLFRETLNISLMFYTYFLVTKEKNSLVLPLLGTFWSY